MNHLEFTHGTYHDPAFLTNKDLQTIIDKIDELVTSINHTQERLRVVEDRLEITRRGVKLKDSLKAPKTG